MVFIATIQLSHCKSSQGEYRSEWAWLHFNEALYTQTGSGLDLAQGCSSLV